MEVLRMKVTSEEDGSTVRHILRSTFHFSSHAISRLSRAETGILVNGQRAFTNRILRAGDLLEVESGDHALPRSEIVPCDWPLPVLWEDGHLLIVDKPAGMTSHASNYLPSTPTVAGALLYSRGEQFIFHPVSRLDKGTSGVMVIAKSAYIHDRLRRVLHTDDFRREYRAVCVGCPSPVRGVIDAPIGRDLSSTVKRTVRQDGLHAVTAYETLSSSGAFSLLALYPETGRTHQLRVHLSHIGCPLAGDWLYGREDPELIPRPALHSFALTLRHPVTGIIFRVEAPLPEDMKNLISNVKCKI